MACTLQRRSARLARDRVARDCRVPAEPRARGLCLRRCRCLVHNHDRAGYGRAARRPGRNVADEAQDVLAVADARGFGRFGVIGGSGGGPHALACAALLHGRVERTACRGWLRWVTAGFLAIGGWWGWKR
jgi:pimeloyl-ACP methyl ester carboxylesterase